MGVLLQTFYWDCPSAEGPLAANHHAGAATSGRRRVHGLVAPTRVEGRSMEFDGLRSLRLL